MDYFDDPNAIGWVRLGDSRHENSGLACVLTNGEASKRMPGRAHANTAWREITGSFQDPITLDEEGLGRLPARPAA